MLSKVRFSLMTKITCLIGVAVSSAEASKGSGAVPYSSGGTGSHSGRSSPQATATRAVRATRATRRTARKVPTRYPSRERPAGVGERIEEAGGAEHLRRDLRGQDGERRGRLPEPGGGRQRTVRSSVAPSAPPIRTD